MGYLAHKGPADAPPEKPDGHANDSQAEARIEFRELLGTCSKQAQTITALQAALARILQLANDNPGSATTDIAAVTKSALKRLITPARTTIEGKIE